MLRTRAAAPLLLLLLAVLVVLVVPGSPAIAEQLPLRSLTTAEGLPHNRIKRILPDSQGFLWFCTTEGLARFDGQAFVNYTQHEGLPVPSINDILEVEGPRYWIATNGGGVVLFDPSGAKGGRFKVHPVGLERAASRVNVLLVDWKGRLWAGTDGGLFRFETRPEPATPDAFQPVPLGFPSRPDAVVQVWALAEDREGTIWAGTKFGLAEIEGDRVVRHAVDPRGTDQVLALLAVEEGLWVGHETAGLLLFEPGRDVPSIRHTRAEGLADDAVQAIARAGDGLWVGTRDGITRIAGGRLETYTTENGLTDGLVTALAEDPDGNLWIGTAAGGAMKLARGGLVTYREGDGLGHTVSGVFETRDGALCATSTGWRVSRLEGRRFRTVRPKLPPELPAARWRFFQSTLEDHEGRWWVATGAGLYRFPPVRDVGELSARAPEAVFTTQDGLASDDVTRLFEDSRGDVWIGTFTPAAGGLVRWERSTGRFHRYGAAQGLPDPLSVAAFCEDAAGSLWIAFREGGVARYRAGAFRMLTGSDGMPSAPVVALHASDGGALYMTSAGAGLLRVDRPAADSPRVTAFGEKEGIGSYYLSGLTEDREGRLYIGTSQDILRFDPATGAVRHLSASDGVVSSEVIAAHRDESGVLWFATWRGLSRLAPEPERTRRRPEIRIGGVSVAGVRLALSDLGVREAALGRLEPSQTPLTVDLFGLFFSAPERLRYQHRLEGKGADWSAPSSSRSLLYANLAPGRYRLLARAVDAEGRVSAVPASISFTVLPPFWRRGWFLAGVAIALALAGYGVNHLRSSRRLLVERVRTRIATDLHDDVGAGLSRIAVLCEVLKKRSGGDVAERLGDIAELARDQVGAMSDIVWATDPRRDDVGSVVRRLRAFAADVLEGNGITFDCKVAPECERLSLDPEPRRELYLILKEGVNNVARHSGASEAVLALALDGRFVEAELHDNGGGVAARGTRTSGFGHFAIHGVPNMKRRAEAIGGSLLITSSPGRGTTVRARVPLRAR